MRALMKGAIRASKDRGAKIEKAVDVGYCFKGAAVLKLARSGQTLLVWYLDVVSLDFATQGIFVNPQFTCCGHSPPVVIDQGTDNGLFFNLLEGGFSLRACRIFWGVNLLRKILQAKHVVPA